ncbi:MAG: PAS domain-containing protein [Kofleriaceae bacterium]|nr:MAG: PAS domain-containing protein [Kofleriaceae bacterium]
MVTAAPMSATERAELIDVIEEVVGLGTFTWVLGQTIAWSRGFYRLLGIDPSIPAAPEMYYERVHPDDRARVIMAAKAVVTRGTVETFPYRIVRPDGSFDWVIGPSRVDRDADGNVTRLIGTIVRVTESHLANERLAQVNALLADTQRAAGIGSYSYDVNARRLEWSDELYRLLGVPPGTPIDGAFAESLVHPEDRAREKEWAAQLFSGETLPPLCVRWIRPSDHKTIYLESISRLVQRPAGPCVVGISQDVTARVEMEQELRHVARTEAVGALAAGIAHDFNNYLTVLSAQLDLMRLNGGPPRPRDLDTMNVALERCAGLVRQLLAFARKHPYRPERLDLAERVETVRALFERVVEPTVQIEVVVNGRPMVQGDATQIDGALMNLLVNARDAMAGGGKLTVELDERDLAEGDARLEGRLPPGRYARLAVSDTGVGIAPEHLPHVFEPYFTTKTMDRGTGLGLAAVLGTTRQHGGAVHIESVVGRGTTVEMLLPLSGMQGKSGGMRVPAVASALAPLRILLVEDLRAVREALAMLLEGEGHQVDTAIDGRDALDRVRDHGPYELVISDVTMPRMGGLELARELAAMVPPVPVLLMTGYADHAAAQSVAVTLDKPFSREELIAGMARVLR